MKPESDIFESANQNLASACQQCEASCCKKGLLFMLPNEVEQIRQWIKQNDLNLQAQFSSLLGNHGDFFLFDQQDACMFLDKSNLCRLHMSGVKPKECFVWPLHIYLNYHGQPEVRVSTTCCDGYKFITTDHPSVEATRNFAKEIGYARLAKFRAIYSGSYGSKFVESVDLGENLRPLTVKDLPRYRKVGEHFFPNENWDSGIARVERMLNRYPQGILAFEEDGEILGYITLWPLTNDAAGRLESGDLIDSNIDEQVIPNKESEFTGKWIITAVGVLATGKEKRRQIILSLLNGVMRRRNPDLQNYIYAHAATQDGKRFLNRTGFRFAFPDAEKLCRLDLL
jgi:Fe-S-cluster containining protein